MSENPIMNVYYTNRTVLFFMCAGNEAFYAALYLLHFTEGPVCKFKTHCRKSFDCLICSMKELILYVI